jgi:hypothetical protein
MLSGVQVCGDRSEVMLPERAKVKLGWRLDLSYESRFAGTQLAVYLLYWVQKYKYWRG